MGIRFPRPRSLSTVLALSFIPISIVPVLVITFYAEREFSSHTSGMIVDRARSERDAIVGEVDSYHARVLRNARTHATRWGLRHATAIRDTKAIRSAIRSFQGNYNVRIYAPSGGYLTGRHKIGPKKDVPAIPKKALSELQKNGFTAERTLARKGDGFVTLLRSYLTNRRGKRIGIVEEEHYFGNNELASLIRGRQLNAVLLNRDFQVISATIAVGKDILKSVSETAFQPGVRNQNKPVFINFGESRYASFLYDLPHLKDKDWGYMALFLSMNSIDASAERLGLYRTYLTGLLIFFSLLLVVFLSRRLVRPLASLVGAMERVQAGRLEQIPEVDSAYEVEYLVKSFNEMASNIHAAKRELEMKIGELKNANAEITNAQSTMVQSAKMASLGELVAGVAHELNNPIGFIHSNMHHLSEYVEKLNVFYANFNRVKDKLPEKERKKMETTAKEFEIDYILSDLRELTKSCVDGAERVKEIVLGLRTFSRTAADTDYRKADLHEALTSTIKLVIAKYKDRVTVHEEFEPIPEVDCNLSQINQVFVNLISNAAQAIETIGDIWIRTRVDGKHVVIEVTDNGAGMPEEVRQKVFDPFFTTKEVGDGTGLGLSIAYGLVEKHGGRIDVKSALGKGTSFEVWLPIERPFSQVS